MSDSQTRLARVRAELLTARRERDSVRARVEEAASELAEGLGEFREAPSPDTTAPRRALAAGEGE